MAKGNQRLRLASVGLSYWDTYNILIVHAFHKKCDQRNSHKQNPNVFAHRQDNESKSQCEKLFSFFFGLDCRCCASVCKLCEGNSYHYLFIIFMCPMADICYSYLRACAQYIESIFLFISFVSFIRRIYVKIFTKYPSASVLYHQCISCFLMYVYTISCPLSLSLPASISIIARQTNSNLLPGALQKQCTCVIIWFSVERKS